MLSEDPSGLSSSFSGARWERLIVLSSCVGMEAFFMAFLDLEGYVPGGELDMGVGWEER